MYKRTCLWYLMLKYGVVGGMICICWLSLEALIMRCRGTDKLQLYHGSKILIYWVQISWAWPHPGRSRRVGHHCNDRFCSTGT